MAEEKEKKKKKKKDEKVKKAENKVSKNADEITAAKQKRAIIMFLSGIMLAAVIYIPGDLVWLWLHNGVRGLCSLLSWYWPLMLITLAVASSIFDEPVKKKKMWLTAAFVSGLTVCFNATAYIFTYKDSFNVKETFTQGISYKGGGVMGFLFGAPFVKLFGITPARILIILVTLVVLVFAVNVHKPVSELYEYFVERTTDRLALMIKKYKRRQAKVRPVKIADDAFFDDDRFDEYDIHDKDEEEDDNAEDSEQEDKGGLLKKTLIKIKAKTAGNTVPDTLDGENDALDDDSSDSTNELRAADQDEFFDEDDNENGTFDDLDEDDKDPFDDDDSYSIDIDIDDEFENNTVKKESVDDYSNEELTEGLFGDLLDDDEPKASKIARDISVNKRNNAEPVNEKRVFRGNTENIKKPVQVQPKYKYPGVDLLAKGKKNNLNYESELRENARKLIETLDSFSVG
ncbi:MAG: DNA translocase FtsK 4TM domain-containing protein, partial [Clostridia bacterium]|nr:DNA translocase FtsK 4TM domain-containing protein [Clostridia bacterium]